jgi:C4-dicarboxylate-specific signal transduction histidine kinase
VQVAILPLLPAQALPRYDLRLSQVVANLLKNAVEATPEGDAVQLTITAAGDRVLVNVEDSGPGIRPDLIPQLFMPFVTTKPKGAGHGLGLAISRELVLSIGGMLTIDNRPEPEHGCVATISLPANPS